jgi:hypothetical protein
MHCRECGSELTISSQEANPVQARDWTWTEGVGIALRYAGWMLMIGLVYLLSFGPVSRYCGTVTSRNSTSATPNGKAVVRTTIVRYPAWVGVVYYPALLLASTRDNVYGRYVEWWGSLGRAEPEF